MDCCGVAPSSKLTKDEEDRIARDKAMMETVVSINGTKLKLSQMFPDSWAAKDFYAKLQIMNATKGGKNLMDDSPASIMDDSEPDPEDSAEVE